MPFGKPKSKSAYVLNNTMNDDTHESIDKTRYFQKSDAFGSHLD